MYSASAGPIPEPWVAEGPLPDATRRSLLSQPGHGLHFAEAFDSRGALSGALREGRLTRADTPGYAILELAAEVPGEAPLHVLFGLTPPQENVQPLEEGRTPSPAPLVVPTVGLAADDHMILRELLAEGAGAGRLLLEGRLDDGRAFRILSEERGPILRRIQGVLAEAPVRPLGPLAERSPSLVAIIPLSGPGWRARAVHRAVKGLEGFQIDTFLRLVQDWARIFPLEGRLDTVAGRAAAREQLGTLSRGRRAHLVVLPEGKTCLLRYRQGLELPKLPAVPKSPTLRSLDLAMLNALVLRTVLGLRDPEAVGHPNVFTVPTLETLAREVDAGRFQVGFGLNPPPIWELRAVMEAGLSLPPRTLRLEPQIPAGLLFGDPDA